MVNGINYIIKTIFTIFTAAQKDIYKLTYSGGHCFLFCMFHLIHTPASNYGFFFVPEIVN